MDLSKSEMILAEKFEIIECLKKDEICSVYRANHRFLAKEIILKTMDTATIKDPANIERFKREARILARLDHDHIIRVLDFGSLQNVLYISFEYFKSRNLRQLIQERELNMAQKSALTRQLIRGVAAAHEKGIIHRDLKPENILVDDSLQLKIADFGLAFVAGESTLTQKSSILGTPGYMSPEQIRGEELTPRSDVFSIGLIIYELFLGSNPLMSSDLNTTLNRILQFDPEQLDLNRSDLPEEIRNILTTSLRKEPGDRAADAAGLSDMQENGQAASQNTRKLKRFAPAAVIIILISTIVLVEWPSSEKPHSDLSLQMPVAPDSQQNITQVDPEQNMIQTGISDEKNSRIKEADPGQITDAVARSEEEKPVTGYLQLFVPVPADIIIDTNRFTHVSKDSIMAFSIGQHRLEISHADFPAYMYEFNISSGDTLQYRIDPGARFSWFHCTVYPWGDVYIDEQYIAQTPFFEPVRIRPGLHLLRVENPGFASYRDSISVPGGDTLKLMINLEKTQDLN